VAYTSCTPGTPPVNDQRNLMTLEDSGEVVFTYDVEWVEDPHTVWAHRWDVYLKCAFGLLVGLAGGSNHIACHH
jgi:hypothetical protein